MRANVPHEADRSDVRPRLTPVAGPGSATLPRGQHLNAPSRFRFGPFVLSTRQRVLWRDGREVPLIPRYFDLLVLLLRRRQDAVHRSDIFSTVWSDVVVSDGALTQAIRALRRTLDDEPREPVYIRTVSRHGYQFVFADVIEEPDEGSAVRGGNEIEAVAGSSTGSAPALERASAPAGALDTWAGEQERAAPAGPATDSAVPEASEIDALVAQLRSSVVTGDERREAAERLHALGTALAVERVSRQPGAARALALLRDTRQDVPVAGPVPFGSGGATVATLAHLVALRAERAWRLAGGRWLSSIAGTALAGLATGLLGGLGLWALPGGQVPATASAVLAGLGALAGAVGAAGIGGGLSATEAIARSDRGWLLPLSGACGGLVVGTGAHWLARWTLEGLFGLSPGPFGGSLEGLVLGAAAGAGYAWATADIHEGMAAPRGRRRWAAAARVAVACAVAAILLGAAGRPMVGGLVNAIAQASRTSPLALTPLARAIGEPEFGPLTAAVAGALEGAAFGCGLALGLTRRPRMRR
jgi:DNA-binding winged helix-turn-helix (wHTH) protein